jgi:hypothetical protein
MARITEVQPAYEAAVVDLIGIEIDNARERITSEASWERLEEFFYQQLVHERDDVRVSRSLVIVAWAEAGHPAAHRAVWRFAREMGQRSRFDNMLVAIRHYVLKTPDQSFIPFPRGRHVVQNMMRDIWLPKVIENAAEGTGLPATRSASTEAPSIGYFTALAMKKRRVKLKEREINRIYWNRNKIAARLEASMPQIPSSIK